jgi:tight adherence protein B
MSIIDTIFLFILAFISFFLVHKLLLKARRVEGFDKILAKKVDAIAKQQDMLLEASVDRVSTFTKLDTEQTEISNEDMTNLVIDKIKLKMKKAGITDMSVSVFVTCCSIGGSIFAAIIVYFDFLNILTGVPIGMCIGAYLVFNILAAQAEAKKMQFLQQFPDAIDMMIRGVKAGLNIARIIKLVSIESKDPVAAEYNTISQKLDLGIEPEKVLVEAADKIDIEEFRFLVVALVLQIENGGVLSEILTNLSGLVRKRLELGLKLKAMSAEARMSANVISALPFVFAGIMAIVNPNHLKEFILPGTGQTLLKIVLVLFSVGSFIMLKATKIKV